MAVNAAATLRRLARREYGTPRPPRGAEQSACSSHVAVPGTLTWLFPTADGPLQPCLSVWHQDMAVPANRWSAAKRLGAQESPAMPAGIWHEEAGRGPAVVFLHAGIADSRMWDPQFESFAARYCVVRFDARGFGRSPYSSGRFSPVEDVRDLLDELAIERAALVAGSFGAAVALDVAIAYPERTWALVLVAPGLRGHPWSDEVQRFQADEEAALEAGDLDEAVELNLRMWVDGPARSPGAVPAEVRERVGEMQRRAFELDLAADALEPPPELVSPLWRTEARLGEIRSPTLVVLGDADVDDVAAKADVIVAAIPGAERAVVADAAHLPSLERPAGFDRLVLEFLDRAAGT
jgi:3-oxoadipate enol-lactonase